MTKLIWMIPFTQDHYKFGVCTVYGSSSSGNVTLTACIESHQFQPKNFWNGRWRSQWTATFSSGTAELNGLLKVQVSESSSAYFNPSLLLLF